MRISWYADSSCYVFSEKLGKCALKTTLPKMFLGNQSSPSRRVPRLGLNFETVPLIILKEPIHFFSLLRTSKYLNRF